MDLFKKVLRSVILKEDQSLDHQKHLEKTKEVTSGSTTPDAKVMDSKSIPIELKKWVSEVSSGKRPSKYNIMTDITSVKYDDYLNSLTKEISQFFTFNVDANGNMIGVKKIGDEVERDGSQIQYTGNQQTSGSQHTGGRAPIPKNSFLAVVQIYQGKYVSVYIYANMT